MGEAHPVDIAKRYVAGTQREGDGDDEILLGLVVAHILACCKQFQGPYLGNEILQELHLAEGSYDISVNYYGTGGTLLHVDKRTGVNVAAGRLNVLESAYLN